MIFHDFWYYFASVVFPYFLFRFVLAELKIFDSFQYLVIEFLLYDLPFYYCVRVERLVVEYEIVDLVDFIPCLFFLLFLLFLSSLLLLDLVEDCAHCEVDFPEDSFEEIGHDCNNDKVHEDEESDDVAILLLSSIAITPGVDCPTAFSENLHHEILWVDESFEVWKLVELVVILVCVYDFLSVVEYFHAEYTKNEKDEGKEVKEFCDNGHYFHKSCEDPFQVVNYWVI